MIKKIGATSILSTITLGGIVQIYSALDNRIRANEIELKGSSISVQIIKEDLKEIKQDVKVIKKIIQEVRR